MSVWSDEKKLLLAEPGKQLVGGDAPGDRGKVGGTVFGTYGGSDLAPQAMFERDSSLAHMNMADECTSPKVEGVYRLEGRDCIVIRAIARDSECLLWLDASTYLVRRHQSGGGDSRFDPRLDDPIPSDVWERNVIDASNAPP